jgi:predicted nucleotidyltransferase
MIDKKDLIDFIRKNKEYFRRELYVEKIGIFGSFARGDQKENSDIDLLVELGKDTPDISAVKEKLRNAFTSRFHLDVDIAREKYLKPYAKKIIAHEVEYIE